MTNGFASIAELNFYENIGQIDKMVNYENLKITKEEERVEIGNDLNKFSKLEEGTIISRFNIDDSSIKSLIGLSDNNKANNYFTLYVSDRKV